MLEKEKNAFNGLETSTFTVCARVRPVLPMDNPAEGDSFACIIPGTFGMSSVTGSSSDGAIAGPSKADLLSSAPGGAIAIEKGELEWAEQCLVMTPKVGITGKPKIEKTSFIFDHVFGPAVDDVEMFDKIGAPLVEKALVGQVGVVFAYGQTGSGKTHTMNRLLARFGEYIFRGSSTSAGAGAVCPTVEFSYLEILGQSAQDCLHTEDCTLFDGVTTAVDSDPTLEEKGDEVSALSAAASALDAEPTAGKYSVRIGELLDGSIKTLGLSSRMCTTATQLQSLVTIAQTRRATQATEKNATSSRSHGIAIMKVHNHVSSSHGNSILPTPGVLYVIDLAGSERMVDSKNHSDERMEETKAINLSLMSLKECIRARTMAGAGDGRSEVHVPYRRSKLTLLMKDVFDISCARLCSTVVLAHVSPLARDVQHSTNTLGYASPLRVATRKSPLQVGMHAYEEDPNDPALFTAAKLSSWITTVAPAVNPSALISSTAGNNAGLEMCRTSEVELFKRVLTSGGSAEDAKKIYAALWMLICDAKVRKRRANGTIITAAQEEAARVAEDVARAEKARVWQEREKHLKTEY